MGNEYAQCIALLVANNFRHVPASNKGIIHVWDYCQYNTGEKSNLATHKQREHDYILLCYWLNGIVNCIHVGTVWLLLCMFHIQSVVHYFILFHCVLYIQDSTILVIWRILILLATNIEPRAMYMGEKIYIIQEIIIDFFVSYFKVWWYGC